MPFRLRGPHGIFWSVDFREIITIVAIKGQIQHCICLNAPNSISVGALPQIPLGELTSLPRRIGDLARFKGPTSKRRKGRGRKGRGERGGNVAFHHLYFG